MTVREHVYSSLDPRGCVPVDFPRPLEPWQAEDSDYVLRRRYDILCQAIDEGAVFTWSDIYSRCWSDLARASDAQRRMMYRQRHGSMDGFDRAEKWHERRMTVLIGTGLFLFHTCAIACFVGVVFLFACAVYILRHGADKLFLSF